MARKRSDDATTDATTEETIEVPVSVLQQLNARLESLEHADRVRREAELNPRANILDRAYEAWKAEVGRPAKERTQDAADKAYEGPLAFRCRLDSTTENGKPGPYIGEHPEVVVRANSAEEAEMRYLRICGIKKHDYAVKAVPVADAT
jgi:hypothetical protein